MTSEAVHAGTARPAVGATGRSGIEAGVLAGLAGLAVFLVLHHLWIVPIWSVAPMGAVMAAAGGAAVGAAYDAHAARLPRAPWTAVAVWIGIAATLAPAFLIAQLVGPVYAMGVDGAAGHLLVPAPQAIASFVVGLLGSATVAGATIGWLIARTRRAAGLTALAGFVLALGPGHNIPFLGGTPAVGKEIAILAAVMAVASVVLVARSADG